MTKKTIAYIEGNTSYLKNDLKMTKCLNQRSNG